MRDIKFRIYDKKTSKMYCSGCFDTLNNSEDGIVSVSLHGYKDLADGIRFIGAHRAHSGTDPQQAILMQYTGLHDLDKKEIYEGDVVTYQDKHWLVKWSDILARFVLAKPDGQGRDFNDRVAEDLYVSGNIYENPELLESEGKTT